MTVVLVWEVLAILVAMALSNLVFVVICGVLGCCYCGASDASSFVIIVMPGFMSSVVTASEPGVGRRGVACCVAFGVVMLMGKSSVRPLWLLFSYAPASRMSTTVVMNAR